MNNFLFIRTALAILFAALFAQHSTGARADIIIHNQNNPLTTTAGGSHGNYQGFNLTLNDVAFTQTFNSPHAAPVPSSIQIQELMLRRSTGAGGTNDVFLKVFSNTTPTSGNFIGVSINTLDMRAQAAESNVSYLFSNLSLATATNYSFYFSTNSSADATGLALGRIRVSNLAADTYLSGNLRNAAFGVADAAFDPVFVVTAIPEPSSVMLVGSLGLLLIRRRRV